LSFGDPLAFAFRYWFYDRIANGVQPWEQAWFYGMTLIGDGMLKPRVPQTALADRPAPSAPRHPRAASVVRHILRLPDSPLAPRPASLLDASGRSVMLLGPGPNDIRGLPAGFYFIVTAGGSGLACRPVLIAR